MSQPDLTTGSADSAPPTAVQTALLYLRDVPLPAIVFGSLFALLLLGAVVIVVNAVRRSRKGQDAIAQRGWTKLPDGADVVVGWDGWPFREALEPGKARDVVVGQHQGVDLMCLRWTQREHAGHEASREDHERYNIVALRTEHTYPHLSVVRGGNRIDPTKQHAGVAAFETGDDRFDRRWQTLGDEEFGRSLLVPEVRAAMDERDHAWVFQPGWVTRVVPWTFYAGEDRMLEEIDHLVAPLRLVPNDVWRRYGGAPRFLQNLGHGHVGD